MKSPDKKLRTFVSKHNAAWRNSVAPDVEYSYWVVKIRDVMRDFNLLLIDPEVQRLSGGLARMAYQSLSLDRNRAGEGTILMAVTGSARSSDEPMTRLDEAKAPL